MEHKAETRRHNNVTIPTRAPGVRVRLFPQVWLQESVREGGGSEEVHGRFRGVGCRLDPASEDQSGEFLSRCTHECCDCGQEYGHQANRRGCVSAPGYSPFPVPCSLKVRSFSSEEQPALFQSYEYLRGHKLGVMRFDPEISERMSRGDLGKLYTLASCRCW